MNGFFFLLLALDSTGKISFHGNLNFLGAQTELELVISSDPLPASSYGPNSQENCQCHSYLSLLRSTREDPRHTKMIFIVLVQGEHRKMCLSTRRRSCQDPSQVEEVALERTEQGPQSHTWLSLSWSSFFLRLFPLDCFPSNADSFGTSWTAWEQNIHTFCFQAGIRINCPLNTATN